MNAAHNALRLRSGAELIANLARIATEAMKAAPEGEALPDTVAHALALIQERGATPANDVDAAAGLALGRH